MPRNGGVGGLNSLTFRLYLYSKINPAIWDAIIPKGPKYSKGTLNVVAAQLIKAVAQSIEEVYLKEELNKLGKQLFSSGTSAMSYEDDDWRCGNEPVPIPHFGGDELFLNPAIEVELNPQPQPPGERYYAALLNLIAESVNNSKIEAQLKKIATQISGTKYEMQ